MKRILFVGFVLLLLSSCSKDDGPAKSAETVFIEDYITSNALTTTSSLGVYTYPIVENPTGNEVGDVISIYYTLTDIFNEVTLDSHQAADGDPIKLLHNASAVFPTGLDLGLTGLKEGETYGIIIPKARGFGKTTVADVESDAVLLFEVEVVLRETLEDIVTAEAQAINDYIITNDLNNTIVHPVDIVVELDNAIQYKRTEAGTGITPLSGDSITIDYAGRLLDESSFDALTGFKYKFNVGGVIGGLDIGVTEMEVGEKATIWIPSDQAYGGSVRVIPFSTATELSDQLVIPLYATKVKPFEVLIFDVTLQTVH